MGDTPWRSEVSPATILNTNLHEYHGLGDCWAMNQLQRLPCRMELREVILKASNVLRELFQNPNFWVGDPHHTELLRYRAEADDQLIRGTLPRG